MQSSALWNNHGKSISKYDDQATAASGNASSIVIVIFLIIATTSIAMSYIRMHQEQNKLNLEIQNINASMALRNKELDNLQVRLEHLKGQEVMKHAPRLGLVPPDHGQVVKISQFRHNTATTGNANSRNANTAFASVNTLNDNQPSLQ